MDLNEATEVPRDNGADEGKNREKLLEKRLEELYSNVRHITQLGMNWYAFFMTLNYVTLGWLAVSGSINTPLLGIVALLFIVQNGFGVFGIYRVLNDAKCLIAQVSTHETSLLKGRDISQYKEVLNHRIIPTALYEFIAWLLIIVMFLLMEAWLVIFMWWWHRK